MIPTQVIATQKNLENGILLGEIFERVKVNDMENIPSLINQFNELNPDLENTDSLTPFLALFKHALVNESTYYVLEHLNGVLHRENKIFETKILELAQRGNPILDYNFLLNLQENPEILQNGTSQEINNLIVHFMEADNSDNLHLLLEILNNYLGTLNQEEEEEQE